MKPEHNISHIAALLQRFYDGSSSPDDECLLAEFFANTDPKSLPDELRADAELFCGLDAIRGEAEDAQMPQELTCALDKIMSPTPVAKTNVWPAIRHYVSIGVAAAALVALCVTSFTLTMSSRLTDATEVSASVEPSDTVVVKRQQLPTVATPAPLAAYQTPPVVTPCEPKSQAVAHRPTATTEVYREVTDPDEAQAIAELCARLLAFGASRSRGAGQQVADNLNEVYQTIQNI